MRGTFNLRLLTQNPFSSLYTVEDIQFTGGNRYRVTGVGTFEKDGTGYALLSKKA